MTTMVLLCLSPALLLLTVSLGLNTRLDFLQGAATTCASLYLEAPSNDNVVLVAPAAFEEEHTPSPPLLSSLSAELPRHRQQQDDATEGTIQLTDAATKMRLQISKILDRDPQLAGPLVRLAFHDATTISSRRRQNGSREGPNASIQYELDRAENRGLAVPLKVVLQVQKEQMSVLTPLSLADTIALAGSEAVHHAGGPFVAIRLGRADAAQADPERVTDKRLLIRRGSFSKNEVLDKTLPSAGLNSDGLRQYASRLGLSEPELVALSGSHGMGRHVSLLGMTKACLKNLTRTCLEEAPVLLPFVASSVDRFDNSYFRYLQKWNARDLNPGDAAFIPTDVALIVDAGLRRHVDQFAQDERAYFDTFATAYQKLVERTATSTGRY
jgi:hypothetical protein